MENRELKPSTQGATAGWGQTPCWQKMAMSVLLGFKAHPPTPSGEGAEGETRGCPHPCPQDAVGLEEFGQELASQGDMDAGTTEPIAFQGEIRICLRGRQAQLQFCQKAGCGLRGLCESQGTGWLASPSHDQDPVPVTPRTGFWGLYPTPSLEAGWMPFSPDGRTHQGG